MTATPPIIAVKDLNVTYFPGRSNEVQALKHISLDIHPGEYIIFFGPSGCGKSTLLYSLAGLERNIQGSIVVKGKDLATMTQTDLEAYYQSSIGMIFQSYYLIASLRVAENVALPQTAIGGPKAARLHRAVELLEKFGVGKQAWKLPMELSGGQQQRVAICRALINEPGILVADEPVGNLDSKSTKDVMDLLRYLNDEQKKTVILVTHDPSHLFHAHRIFYLRDGEITSTKVNTEQERKQPTVTPATGSGIALASALSHWVRTFVPAEGQKPDHAMALGRQTQEILAEVLTGLSVEEILFIEQKLYDVLSKGKQDTQTIYAFLRKSARTGGIGMERTRAKQLAGELLGIARKIHRLDEIASVQPRSDGGHDPAGDRVREIRQYLIKHCRLRPTGLDAVAALDEIIRRRLDGVIDRAGVQRSLWKSVKGGGAGVGLFKARKCSSLLEAFVGDKPTPQPGSSAAPPVPSLPPASHEDASA